MHFFISLKHVKVVVWWAAFHLNSCPITYTLRTGNVASVGVRTTYICNEITTHPRSSALIHSGLNHSSCFTGIWSNLSLAILNLGTDGYTNTYSWIISFQQNYKFLEATTTQTDSGWIGIYRKHILSTKKRMEVMDALDAALPPMSTSADNWFNKGGPCVIMSTW